MNSNDFVCENHDSMILIKNHKRRDLGLRITVMGTPLSPLYKMTGAYPENYEQGEG